MVIFKEMSLNCGNAGSRNEVEVYEIFLQRLDRRLSWYENLANFEILDS